MISVVPAGIYNKTKPMSIHGRKNVKLDRSDLKANDSILVRRLANNIQDRF